MSEAVNPRQEVNLYTLDFRREEQAFSFRAITRYAVIFFGLLMLVEGYTAWEWWNNAATLQDLQAQEQTVNKRLLTLKQTQPLSQRPKLEQELARLQTKIQQRRELQEIMGGQKFGNFDGFSEHLMGLARQSNGNLALTHFDLLEGGNVLQLQGWTKQAQAVPDYLQQLRTESSFESVRFGVLRIERDDKYKHKLKFVLSQKAGGNT